jgi:hypothetical protein
MGPGRTSPRAPAALDVARPMPALIDKPVSEAVASLERLGLAATLVDKDGKPVTDAAGRKVSAQGIDTGRLAPLADPVLLTVE